MKRLILILSLLSMSACIDTSKNSAASQDPDGDKDPADPPVVYYEDTIKGLWNPVTSEGNMTWCTESNNEIGWSCYSSNLSPSDCGGAPEINGHGIVGGGFSVVDEVFRMGAGNQTAIYSNQLENKSIGLMPSGIVLGADMVNEENTEMVLSYKSGCSVLMRRGVLE